MAVHCKLSVNFHLSQALCCIFWSLAGFFLQVFLHVHVTKCVAPPSCPLLRRTISCLAPMLPNMASSSLAFMSLDFLNVKLFMRSNAFFPCMVNTTWALFPWKAQWVRGQRAHSAGSYLQNRTSKQSKLVAKAHRKKSKQQRYSTAGSLSKAKPKTK